MLGHSCNVKWQTIFMEGYLGFRHSMILLIMCLEHLGPQVDIVIFRGIWGGCFCGICFSSSLCFMTREDND